MTNDPLEVLTIVAAPTGGTVDGGRVWSEREAALAPLVRAGHVKIERLEPARIRDLEARVARGASIVHIVTAVAARPEVSFFAFAFETSSRALHGVNAQSLGACLRKARRLRLLVLECGVAGPETLALVAARVAAESGATVAAIPMLEGPACEVFLRSLYAALAAGETVEQSVAHAKDALVARGFASLARASNLVATSAAKLESNPLPVVATQETPLAWRQSRTLDGAVAAPAAALSAPFDAAHREIGRKRSAGIFDVFFCHNSVDKPAVKQIAHELMERGILPWLDEWELPPGQPWQSLIEAQIRTVPAAAVFVGASDYGNWQREELQAFLDVFVERGIPVIPVLLPQAPDRPEISPFLRNRSWVDFRRSAPDPMERLVWGITQRRATASSQSRALHLRADLADAAHPIVEHVGCDELKPKQITSTAASLPPPPAFRSRH